MFELSMSTVPPYSYTGVHRIGSVGLGWVAGTVVTAESEADADRWAGVLGGYLPGVVERVKYGSRHYSFGLAAPSGTWTVWYDGRGAAEGTLFVQVRQGAFELLDDGRDVGLARVVAAGVRLSRLDLWWDDAESRVRPEELWALMKAGLVRPRAQSREFTEYADGHGILRLGGRQSERYQRVYDKWDGAGRRVRHELEVKGSVAAEAGELLGASAQLADLFDREYERMFWPVRAGV
jgi:hypothetical protein